MTKFERIRKPETVGQIRNCFSTFAFRVCVGFRPSFEFSRAVPRVLFLLLLRLEVGVVDAPAQSLNLPPRAATALSASNLLPQIAPLDLREREERLSTEILSGNIPDFLRTL